MQVRKPTEEEIREAERWPTWEKGVSEFDWEYGEQETCYILEGRAMVTAEGGETVSFEAGDWVIFEPGLECTWKIEDPMRKHYKLG